MVDRCLLFVYKRIGDEIAFMGVRVFVYREAGASIDLIIFTGVKNSPLAEG